MFGYGWTGQLLQPLSRSERTIATGVCEVTTAIASPNIGGAGQAVHEHIVSASGLLVQKGAGQILGEHVLSSAYANRYFVEPVIVIHEHIVEDTNQIPKPRGIDIYEEGSLVASGATHLDFIGSDVLAAVDGAGATVTHPQIGSASVNGSDQTVDSFTIASAPTKGVLWLYTAENGSNQRTGYLMATWEGSNREKGDFSTSDLGDTSDLSLDVVSDGTTVSFVSTSTATWEITYRRMFV